MQTGQTAEGEIGGLFFLIWNEVWLCDFIPKAAVKLNGCQKQRRLNATSLLSLQRCFLRKTSHLTASHSCAGTLGWTTRQHIIYLCLREGISHHYYILPLQLTVGFKHSSVALSINGRFYKSLFFRNPSGHTTHHRVWEDCVSLKVFTVLCLVGGETCLGWIFLAHSVPQAVWCGQWGAGEALRSQYDSPGSLHGSRFSSKPTHQRLKWLLSTKRTEELSNYRQIFISAMETIYNIHLCPHKNAHLICSYCTVFRATLMHSPVV